tara:strand:- start:277 stop:1020 length:744 start_codon:yes stop_codon:yes gene_type:complete
MGKKMKIGFYSLSCCEGCELVFFDLEENMLKALDFVEVVEARLFDGKHPDKKLDVAIIEGGVQTELDKEHLLQIRKRADYVIGFGACATIAGVPGMRNALPEKLKQQIKKKVIIPIKEKVLPINALVKTDYLMQGCPVFTHELLDILVKLYHGIKPVLDEMPVCKECKEQSNPCLLFEGIPCLGSVSYAGCKALCPNQHAQCIGCRGFTKDGNFSSLREKFREMKISEHEIKNLFTYFNPDPFEGEE